MRWIVLSLVALLLLGAIGLLTLRAVQVLRSPGPSAAPSPTVRVTTAVPKPAPTDVVGTVIFRSIGDLDSSPQLTPGQPFRLSIRQEELTARLRKQLAADPSVPIRDVTVSMRPGLLVLQGKVTTMGLTVDTVATGEPVIENGRARIVVKDVDVGRVPVPGAVKSIVTDAISRNLGPDQFNVPAIITSVAVEEGQMTIIGRSR